MGSRKNFTGTNMETDGWPTVDRSAKQMNACELTGTESAVL
jgi:hypothetical protein